jgi:carbamoyltransferase
MNDYLVLSAYGSHNAAISMFYKGEYTVVEVERWINQKNAGLTSYLPSTNPQLVFDEITDWLLAKAGRSSVDVYIPGYINSQVTPKFQIKKTEYIDHHLAHAAAAFYQSPFEKSLVISVDGGGDGSYFNFYEAHRHGGIKLLDRLPNDLGFPYMFLAEYLSDIKKDILTIGNLVYAGKLMGLCSYGTVREDWLPHFKEYYLKYKYSGEAYQGGLEMSRENVTALMTAIGLGDEFDYHTTRFEGQVSWDIAATTQRAFEDVFLELAQPYLEKYADWPVSISGGCGLNVLMNARLLEIRGGNVFVPPNTSDCGISVGAILAHINPTERVDLTYSGLPILDDMLLSSYIQDKYKYTVYEGVTVEELAEFVAQNNIVGLIQGNSEHGSRALGNRSIICNPAGNMKDVLNKKVKDREWYRPFAPITRLQDANKYFHFDYNVESRHMTFVANVREEWKESLPAITHNDGTARLQTVTLEQNPLIYNLITEFEKHSGHGVILNTSFNVNGKPILSRLSDAFDILDNTQLDAIYYKGNLIFKKENDRKFSRSPIFVDKSDRSGIAINAFALPKNDVERVRVKANLEILADFENVTVATDSDGLKKFPSKNFNMYEIEPRHVYMSHFHGKKEVRDAADHIKLLWSKEILVQDRYLCSHAAYIDLTKFDPETFRKDLSNLLVFAKNDDHVVISGVNGIVNEIFDEQWQQEHLHTVHVGPHPTTKFFGGKNELAEKVSNQWEAMYMWYNNNGKSSDNEIYYLIPALLGSQTKFKIIEE